MQTLGHSSGRAGTALALSLLERAGWLEKLPLTLICGALLGFSSAGYGIWWLAWIGLAPLILLIYGSKSKTDAALTGLLFGLAYHMTALRWLFDLHPLNWFGISDALSMLVAGQVWFVESLHQSLLTAAFALFVYSLPMRSGILPHWERPRFPFLLSVPIIWIFLQWVVAPAPFFLGVPIDQLAYSQARMPEFIQIARFGGALSLDFLIVLANSAIAAFLIELTNVSRKLPSRADVLSDKLGAVFDLILVGAVFFGLASWGQSEVRRDAAMPPYWQWPRDAEHKPLSAFEAKKVGIRDSDDFAPAVPIAIVQGNIPIEKLQNASGTELATTYLPLMRGLGTPLLVLPPNLLGGPKRGYEPMRAELPKIATSELKDIILGVRENSGSGYADAVRVISADGHREPDYIKYRPVPFAEYTPLGPLGAIVPEAVQQRLQGGRVHVRPDKLPTPKTAFGKIGASMSAEIVYPDLIVSEVNRGASLLVNVSDLSYFHDSMLSQELLAAACLRAVENGRYVVIASNTGVSAVIDPHGVVSSASFPGRSGVIFDRVQFLHKRTPFARLLLWTPLYK
jgi:apolipoprotein N-acyltransferase